MVGRTGRFPTAEDIGCLRQVPHGLQAPRRKAHGDRVERTTFEQVSASPEHEVCLRRSLRLKLLPLVQADLIDGNRPQAERRL